jgi:hypothetical protein
MWRVFTARYALSPYIKQIRFVFKGLMNKEWARIRKAPVVTALEALSWDLQGTTRKS